MPKHVLVIGRIVYVTTPDGPCPAIVTQADGEIINCVVFEDRPGNEGVIRWTSIPHDPAGTLGTWHWPDEARAEETKP